MKLINLLNCIEKSSKVSIIKDDEQWDSEVYVCCTDVSKIPQDLVKLIENRTVKYIYTINDVIKINIE